MATLLEALGNRIKSAYCAAAGPIANGLGALGAVYKGLGGVENGEDLQAAAGLYRAGQQAACNRQPDDVGPALENPLTNGQCPQLYRVTTTGTTNSQVFGSTTRVRGPDDFLGPITTELVRITFSPNNAIEFRVFDGQGTLRHLIGQNTTDPNDSPTITGISVDAVPLGNNPDNCGGPAPLVPPFNPNDWRSNDPITYDDNGGNPVTISPTIQFGPADLSPTGGLSVPVTVTFDGDINLNLNFDVETGDINLFPRGGGGDDALPPGIEDPEDPNDGTGEGRIVGATVRVTELGSGAETTEINQTGGNPSVLIPYVGLIAFRYKTSNGSTAWGRDIPVKNLDFVAWADRPAVEVKGTPSDGYSFVVTPIVEREESLCQ